MAKTELIHFHNQKRELPGNLTLKINNEIIIIPVKKISNSSKFDSIEN
jgi:hypothetical protein